MGLYHYSGFFWLFYSPKSKSSSPSLSSPRSSSSSCPSASLSKTIVLSLYPRPTSSFTMLVSMTSFGSSTLGSLFPSMSLVSFDVLLSTFTVAVFDGNIPNLFALASRLRFSSSDIIIVGFTWFVVAVFLPLP